jgi:hypothetical protein
MSASTQRHVLYNGSDSKMQGALHKAGRRLASDLAYFLLNQWLKRGNGAQERIVGPDRHPQQNQILSASAIQLFVPMSCPEV